MMPTMQEHFPTSLHRQARQLGQALSPVCPNLVLASLPQRHPLRLRLFLERRQKRLHRLLRLRQKQLR